MTAISKDCRTNFNILGGGSTFSSCTNESSSCFPAESESLKYYRLYCSDSDLFPRRLDARSCIGGCTVVFVDIHAELLCHIALLLPKLVAYIAMSSFIQNL